MSDWQIDYSAKSLDGYTIANTPVGPSGEHPTGVLRYIDDITNPALVKAKHVTPVEYASLLAAGLSLDAMYMEVGADDPLGGYAQGQAYARRALAGADYLGFTGKILFCCDRWLVVPGRPSITPALWQAYLDGAVSVLGRGRAGGYGFADAADASVGHVDYFVQCGSRAAVRPFANGWQDNNFQPMVGGIQADRVQILTPFSPSSGGGTNPNLAADTGELMERVHVVPPNNGVNTQRVWLSGTQGAGVIVRPKIGADGTSNAMWVGNIFAWGSDKQGIGHNPKMQPGYNDRLTSHRRYELPGAVWADIEYSAATTNEFDIDCF